MSPDIGPTVSVSIGIPQLTEFVTMASSGDTNPAMFALFASYGETSVLLERSGMELSGKLRSLRFGLESFGHYHASPNSHWFGGIHVSMGALRDAYDATSPLSGLSRWSFYMSGGYLGGYQIAPRTHLSIQLYGTLAFDGFISLDRGDLVLPVTFNQFFW